MKNSRRIFVLTALFALIAVSLLTLAGCYSVKSGKMKNVEGTYELTGYSTDVNEIEENGIKLYVVIKSNGEGYYAYTDNDTPLYFAELKCRFTQDPEKSGYYSYVELNFTGKFDDWEKLGINAGWREKNLNSNLPKYSGSILNGTYSVDYYVNVDFTRVSRKTDLSYLESKLGKHELRSYGTVSFDGVYAYSGAKTDNYVTYDVEDPFVYTYLNLDLYNGKGEAWYMLKSDGERQNVKFDARLAYEEGVWVMYLGSVRAAFDNNAPFYGAMKVPAKLLAEGEELDGYYCYTLYTGMSAEEIASEIEMKILSYEESKQENE